MNEVSSEFASLADSLADIAVKIARVANQQSQLEGVTLTRSQRSVLQHLSANGPCAMLDLAAGVGVTPPTMTSTIKILMRKKLVERRHDDHDWRTVLVTISESGLHVLAGAVSHQSRQIGRAIQQLPAEQRAMLMVAMPSLRALAAALTMAHEEA